MAGIVDNFVFKLIADMGDLDGALNQLDSKIDSADDKSKKLEKDIKGVSNQAGGVGKLKGAFSDLEGAVTNVISTFGGLVTAVMSLGAIAKGISDAGEYAEKMGTAAGALGVAVDDLSAYSNAVNAAGGNADNFLGALQGIDKHIQDTRTNGVGSLTETFMRLGVSIRNAQGGFKTTLEVLPQLADKFATMNRLSAQKWGKELGFDDSTIALLQKGRKEVEAHVAQQKQLFTLTNEQVSAWREFKSSLSSLGTATRGAFMQLSYMLLPALKWVVDKAQDFTTWAQKNKQFLVITFGVIGVAAMALGAKMAAAWAIALWPVTLVIAALTLLGAIIDDVWSFIEGGDSVMGEMLKAMGLTGEEIEAVRQGLKDLGAMIAKVAKIIWDTLLKTLRAIAPYLRKASEAMWKAFGVAFRVGQKILGGIWESFKKVFEGIKKFIQSPIDAVKELIQWLKELLDMSAVVDKATGWINDKWESVKSAVGLGDDKPKEKPVKLTAPAPALGNTYREMSMNSSRDLIRNSNAMAQGIQNTNAMRVGGNVSNSSQKVEVKAININTPATDTAGISRQIASNLQREIAKSTANSATGLGA